MSDYKRDTIKRILVFTSVMFVVLVLIFSYILFLSFRYYASSSQKSHYSNIKSAIETIIANKKRVLHATLHSIESDKNIQELWSLRNSANTKKRLEEVVKRLRVIYEVDHLKIYDIRGSVLFSACHMKMGRADGSVTIIKEVTETGVDLSGIEVGNMGTLGVWAVAPWRLHSKKVGHIEAGVALDKIIKSIAEITKTKILIFPRSKGGVLPVFKKHEQGLVNNEVINFVLNKERFSKTIVAGERMNLAKIEIKDYKGDDVATLIVFWKIQKTIEYFTKLHILTILSILLFCGVMLFLFYFYLSKLVKRLDSMNESLLRSEVEKKERELQMQQTGKLASIGTLGAGVAHELNNPLAIVKGFIGRMIRILKQGPVDMDKVAAYALECGHQCERMEKIINHLREFSRDAGSRRDDIVSPAECIEESLILLYTPCEKARVIIVRKFGKDIPNFVVNKIKIESVLQNIIKNSIDALATHDINQQRRITIELVHDIEEEAITIVVVDNGPGMPKDVIEKIYDPFFTTKDVGKGTGLGMSLVYNIIDEHEGKINITSTEGKGTTVKFKLPLEPYKAREIN